MARQSIVPRQRHLGDFHESTLFPVEEGDVRHPLVQAHALGARDYQRALAEVAVEGSLLVVVPTGLGKTAIAALAAAETLRRDPGALVLVVAPTRPLVLQHAHFLRQVLAVDAADVVALTGRDPPTRRADAFGTARIIASTPQGLVNDVAAGRVRLDRVGLLVVDEAHRAVGAYAYVPLAAAYREARPDALVLGLTASPGGDAARIREVTTHLGVERVEARTLDDPQVRDHRRSTDLDVVTVRLPEGMEALRGDLRAVLAERLAKLKAFLPPNPTPDRIGKTALLEAGAIVRTRLARSRGGRGFLFAALLHQQAAVQAVHCLELLETQGVHPLRDYLERAAGDERPSRGLRSFLADPRVVAVRGAAAAAEASHPKEDALVREVRAQRAARDGSLVLVFAQYRDTVRRLVARLRAEGVPAERFVGQADRGGGDDGLTQDEQREALHAFRDGETPVLVATSVAEEGLHVPAVDLVVFYEPVPSEIRTIQRRGRTGRDRDGRVVVLVAEGTRDESNLRAETVRERRMRRLVEKWAPHPVEA